MNADARDQPEVERIEWIVNPQLSRALRDKLLTRLKELERDDRILLWMEHWYDNDGQFRYKYVVTPRDLYDVKD